MTLPMMEYSPSTGTFTSLALDVHTHAQLKQYYAGVNTSHSAWQSQTRLAVSDDLAANRVPWLCPGRTFSLFFWHELA